jgi:arsenite/tail-anchored protein-transporting ATPase
VPALQRSRRRTTPSLASKRRSKATSTTPADPSSSIPRFHFVGGKGGVGKTTCAASIAIAAAKRRLRTLVISTDPAPSLGDALQASLSHQPRRVALGGGTLYAAEIDAPRALRQWLRPRRRALEQIALRGTWLDEDDVAKLLRLSLPGIDEVAALLEIARFGADRRFDLIVVDTAPTGHTLRMLTMPETLRRVATAFDSLQAKHRVVVEALVGTYAGDNSDALIEEIDRQGGDLAGFLRDAATTRVSWVTLPEDLSVDETEAAVLALTKNDIPVRDVIVNRRTPVAPDPCRWCAARRAVESRAITHLRSRFPRLPTIEVAARAREPRGLRMLAEIGAEIGAAPPMVGMPVRSPRVAVAARASVRSVRVVSARMATKNFDLFDRSTTRLVLFGGKGGVGKTTCAAATALVLAEKTDETILLLSTDPAHSVASVLGQHVGATPRRVRGAPANLKVREIDASRELQRIRTRYSESIDALFDRLVRHQAGGVDVDASYDREATQRLIALAPPGIDELAAVIEVMDAIETGAVRTMVIDTAPTGHALRLLEMPELVHDWTKALMSILLKYQSLAGIGEFGPALVKLSQGLGRLRTLLTDPIRTSFIVVTRGAALPREETRDLLRRLDQLTIRVPAVVVNAVGRGTCRRCQSEARIEQRHITGISREVQRPALIVIAPAELPPPHGEPALRRWRRQWSIFEREKGKGKREKGILSKVL